MAWEHIFAWKSGPDPEDDGLRLPILTGAVVAIVGGLVWGGLCLATGIQIGLMMWALGVMVGFVMVGIAIKPSSALAGAAVTVTLVGLLAGKLVLIEYGDAEIIRQQIKKQPDRVREAVRDQMIAAGEIDAAVVEYWRTAGDLELPSPGLQEKIISANKQVGRRYKQLSDAELHAAAQARAEREAATIPFIARAGMRFSLLDLPWFALALGSAGLICAIGFYDDEPEALEFMRPKSPWAEMPTQGGGATNRPGTVTPTRL